MTNKRFSELEILKILEEYKDGNSIPDILEKYGISQATFYNWRSKYGELSTSDVSLLEKLKKDNKHLKLMFADISLKNLELKAKLKSLRKKNC